MKKRGWVRNLGLVTQLGITMITPILICTFIGIFIDEKIHKAPLFTLGFIILGAAAGFRNLFYTASKQAKKNEKEDRNE